MYQLWVKYSDGRFGFSVQKRIWESVGKDSGKFGDRVSWSKGMFVKKWRDYDELIFSTNAPEGHLPALQPTSLPVGAGAYLLGRVQTCKL
ncbi:MAG: hypothetical protein F6K28_03965 [Microcoleus sp. SIO2G3]|nr:hypothetical protein [Microcoleus sp. SIO2G3]